jgi:hypothetical protein
MEPSKNDKKDQASKAMSKKTQRRNRASIYPPLPPAFRRVTRSQTAASLKVPPRPKSPPSIFDKENAPVNLLNLKPLVAKLPTYKEHVGPIIRRHSVGCLRPLSPERLQGARRETKSAEVGKAASDWFEGHKPVARNLIPAFVAALPKSSTAKTSEVAASKPKPAADAHVFAVPNLRMWRRAQYFDKIIQQKKKEMQSHK